MFSDDDILNIIVKQLQGDTRYDIALAVINSELTLKDTFQRHLGHSIFPKGLKIKNLPSTIMSYYSETDKQVYSQTSPPHQASLANSTHWTTYLMQSSTVSMVTIPILHEKVLMRCARAVVNMVMTYSTMDMISVHSTY
mmetsp:Transcript_3228/g.4537  ORF Transcript_3228/g.4537 Transcript_3228/m.4537 type:complete len:139 (-) Transcript_3228:1079-1495(-)